MLSAYSAPTGATTTTYHFDLNDPTGYAQVIEERVDGGLARTTTAGLDVVSEATGFGTPCQRAGRIVNPVQPGRGLTTPSRLLIFLTLATYGPGGFR